MVGQKNIKYRIKMEQILELEKMSVSEKIQMINHIWESIETEEKDFESPKWHNEVLLSRKENVDNGTTKFKSLEVVKNELNLKFQ